MKNFKKVILISIGIIIGTSTIVGAATIFNSKDITYSSPTNKINVKDSLDELYDLTSNYEFYKPLADQVELGDYISMTPTSTSYTIRIGLTGWDSEQEINPSNLNLWRVIKKNEDGTVDVVSEYISDTFQQKGKTSYINLVGSFNEIADQYTNKKYVQSARSMGYNGQTEYITDMSKIDSEEVPWTSNTVETLDNSNPPHLNKYESLGGGDTLYERDMNLVKAAIGTLTAMNSKGEESAYLLCGRVYTTGTAYGPIFGRYAVDTEGDLFLDWMYVWKDKENGNIPNGCNVRPILTLKANDKIVSGDGKSIETAYRFE